MLKGMTSFVPVLGSGYSYLWELVPGLPTPLAWWQPKADSLGLWTPATIAESYTNVATPGTYNAAPGTAPAWAAATGWTFTAASSQYLTTGLVPDANSSMLVCLASMTGASTYLLCGSLDATGRRFSIARISASGKFSYAWGDYAGSGSVVAANGTMVLVPQNGYRNGLLEWTKPTAVWQDVPAIFLGAYNNNGSPSNYMNGVLTLGAVWSSDISSYIASLYTVLQAAGLTV